VMIVAGLALTLFAARRRATSLPLASGLGVGGVAVAAAGVLAQRGGAGLFFAILGFGIVVALLVPAIRNSRRAWVAWQLRRTRGVTGAGSAAVPAILMALLLGAVVGPAPKARAEAVPEPIVAATSLQSIVQRWDVREHRLYGEIEATVRGAVGDSFLLLKAPGVLTDFKADGVRVAKVERDDGIGYYAMPERAGTLVVRAKFEMPVADIGAGLPVLTGSAAVQRIVAQIDQPGWEFRSPRAVEITPLSGLRAGSSGATIVLGTAGDPAVQLVPQRRDVDAETPRYFAEVANLFMPGAGVVNAYVRVDIRPVQGRISAVDLRIPAGFSVSDVGRGPAGAWRFDPEHNLLHVAVEPAQSEAFRFAVELQRSAAALPFDASLRPVHVNGAAGEVGTIGLGFGTDAQPEQVRPTALSPVNVDDFDRDLVPKGSDRQPLATVQSAYRYNAENAMLALRVAPVAPEVRVVSRTLWSLGDDRLVLAADLKVAITRVGLFQLSFTVPRGLEVEAVSGTALAHWAEAEIGGEHVVVMHLSGRTIGEQAFAITLNGPAPAPGKPWAIPDLRVREATRQTGELQVVPERGLRLRPIERWNVSELDPRSVGAARPGALAFRLLQDDWALTLGIEALDPWITVQALQEVTMREGQTVTRLALRYRIENAAVKQLRVRLPGLTAEQGKTVRATGPAVSDAVLVAGAADQWEIRFQRGILGETPVQIEYQGTAANLNAGERIATPAFEGARQVVQFVAVRGGGRLELEAPQLPRGWQRVDWTVVPPALQDRGDRSVPSLAFRVAEPEGPLTVNIRRHEVADALKLRVTSGELTTLFSPAGPALTAVDLRVDVAEKSTLRVRLPAGARLFNTLMNGESVAVVRDGDAYLFHVSPNTAADASARVRFVYAVTTVQGGSIALLGPRLNLPLENVSWRVVLPPGHRLASYRGGLQLREERSGHWFGVSDYQAMIVSKRAADARQATEYLQTANTLLQQGQQQQASEVLMRAAKTSGLDEASNEDARVQLRALREQQAVLGLNTRRQRLYLDNSAEAQRNEQIEQAANLNPLMRGKLDFDPQQLDQLLMGNTVEENTALHGIAVRIVDQQLAADVAPRAIDVSLPERGEVVTFARSLQVNGDAPLELTVTIRPARSSGRWFGLGLLASLGAVGLWWVRPFLRRV
jgi:hypothetical protein